MKSLFKGDYFGTGLGESWARDSTALRLSLSFLICKVQMALIPTLRNTCVSTYCARA